MTLLEDPLATLFLDMEVDRDKITLLVVLEQMVKEAVVAVQDI
tara:strand:- start:69 stop:197 length:129 start_codon:yes stop_codon:yes gene_type:complete